MYRIKPRKFYSTVENDEILCHHEGLANYIFKNDVFEKSMIDWCAELYGNKNKVFVDIGAHIGTYAWTLAPHFKHTHAFEPNKEVFNVLCGNISIKGLSNKIDTYCLGVSDTNTTLTYYSRSADGGMNGFSETEMVTSSAEKLQVITLDSLNLENIGLIKIDVEGHEIEVLEGMVNTISKNNHPPIIFESWQPGMHPEFDDNRIKALRKELLDAFKKLGYETTQLNGYPEIFLAHKEEKKKKKRKQ